MPVPATLLCEVQKQFSKLQLGEKLTSVQGTERASGQAESVFVGRNPLVSSVAVL